MSPDRDRSDGVALVARALQHATRPLELVTAASPAYEATRQVWNGAVDRRPAVIVRCHDTADVCATLQAVTAFEVPVTVRGGGHDWSGRSIGDGVVLDLRGMNRVTVEGECAVVQGGATSSDVLDAALPLGLGAVTGTVGAVGFAGLSLGGGYGRLMSQYGLAADNVLSAEVVLAGGRRVVASPHENSDLYWAVRGGGGNFGVVTELTVALHPAATAHTGLIAFPLEHGAAVIDGWRALVTEADAHLAAMMGALTLPDIGPVIFLSPGWTGSDDAAHRLINRVTSWAPPVMTQFEAMPLAAAVHLTDALLPVGRGYHIDTQSVLAFSDRIAEQFLDAAHTMTSPTSALNVHHFHGAATRVPPDATAVAERREHFLVEIIAAWDQGPAHDHVAWARTTSARMSEHALPGGYVNLLAPDQTRRVAAAFGSNADRLRKVKAKYDPDGVFTSIGALT